MQQTEQETEQQTAGPAPSGSERTAGQRSPMSLVWDWPLRIWHWLFALSIAASLTTGLMGEISLMEWHLWLGYSALALLLFRVGWALWGARYARLGTLRTSPRRIAAHFRGRGGQHPRTAPGVALTLLLLAAVAAQAITGLYATDDIFTEGPMVRHADDATVDALSGLHHTLYWGVLALIALHLLAHLVYALRGDATPLSMFTGRKRVAAEPVRHLPVRAALTAAASAAVVWWGLSLM